MQSKNLLLFGAVAILIWFGWGQFAAWVWPPKPPQAEPEESEWAAVPKNAQSAGDLARSAANSLLVKKDDRVKKPEPPAREPSAQTLTLGDDPSRYHLLVVVTTRGAGVSSVTLNKFNGADDDGKDTGEWLGLIPPDPDLPSFLLFHYPDPEQTEGARPLDVLGRAIWDPAIPDAKTGGWKRVANLKKALITRGDVQTITFVTDVPGREYKGVMIAKTFELAPRTYHIGLRIEIRDTRKRGKELTFRYQLAGPHGLPVEGKWYTSTTRTSMVGLLDAKRNLQRVSEEARRISVRGGGDPVPTNHELNDNLIQYAGIATQYFASVIAVDNRGDSVPPRILQWVQPTLEYTKVKGKIVGLPPGRLILEVTDDKDEKQKERLSFAIDPRCVVTLTGSNDTVSDLQLFQTVYVGYAASRNPLVAKRIQAANLRHHGQFDDITVRVASEVIRLKPGDEPRVDRFVLYNGPVKVRLLKQFSGDKEVDAALVNTYLDDLHLNTLTDFHSDNWFGRFSNTIGWTFLLIQCTNLMHWLLGILHSIVPVYGLCIIMLTVLVRGMMFPISRKQAYLSMKMQALAPEMKKLQEKYKNDPQAKTQAMMELYRRHGVNPLAGCLPLLLQMPIFLGLYYCLQESIFFRLAGFLWIDNLAAPDMLIRWGDGIPLISNPENLGGFGYLGPYFNLLPVLAVTLMIVQQKILMPPPADENAAMQQKMMKYMMIFFGLMFYKVAAGLCLYFIASSLWGLAERKMLPKKQLAGNLPPSAASGPPRGGGTPAKPGPRPKKPPQSKKDGDGRFKKVREWWAEKLKQARKK
jgi:YidC/Oxa1 family membrane protein insertase